MDRASVSRIEGWDSRPVAGGYVGLAELADDGFTGAVESGGTRLLMLNGRIVGVFHGSISAFEDGDANAYESPDPALPLLFAMQELGGDVRGQYYTDDTPLREVDETLSSGGFTGYLELSEHVLSGDYYVVYYGGRSLSVAFVGNEERVVTGDEALELAEDEVGIYEVRAVDLEVQDVPEPPTDAGTTTGVAESSDESVDGAADDAEEVDEAGRIEEDDAPAPASGPPAGAAEGDVSSDEETEPIEEAEAEKGDEQSGPASTPIAAADEEPDVDSLVEEAETDADVDDGPAAESPTAESPEEDAPASAASSGSPSAGAIDADSGTASRSTGAASSQREPERSQPDERFEEEARWREARTVPALDPEESEGTVDRTQPASGGDGGAVPDPSSPAEEVTVDAAAFQERIDRLEAELEASERERRRLTDRLEDVVDDRDEIESERTALAERIESLEARIERAEADASGGSAGTGSTAVTDEAEPGPSTVDPETALNQTDLFVRYGSKGKATLATAHDGQASADEVAENLRIETHSRFDAETATVGDQPFEAFLEGTIQYRFVSWLVEELLYEIQGTGTEAGLRELYDVLPNLDRAEFNGTVAHRDEDGEDRREQFDVVCRDRMGKPLVVANLNDSLDPATGDMMATLVEDATEAAEAHESMGAAFLVTASFFQPDALETAAEATRGGGFLSRDSKKSYVKLARNGGYHLCLVEARADDFHVAVPEF